MSGIINKAKEALAGNSHDSTTTSTYDSSTPGHHTTNDGPHGSNVGNKLDPRVDSDRDGRNDPSARTGGLGQSQGYTGSSTGTGAHNTTGFGGHGNTPVHNTTTHSHTSNDGPHSSNLLNKLDPRVDSDRDGRNDPSSRVGGVGEHQGYTGSSTTSEGHANYGRTDAASHGFSGAGTGTGAGSHTQHTSNAGPHSSNLANKLDPRVDSDRDGRNDPSSRVGGIGEHQGYTGSSNTTAGHANYGRTDAASHGLSGTGTGAGVGSHTQHTSNDGPHSSNIANKLDPRVDSDRDGRNDPSSRVGGVGEHQGYTSSSNTTAGHASYGRTDAASHGLSSTGTGAGTGIGGHSQHTSNAGPHSSNVANKLDPRVDSDRDGRNDPSSRVGGIGEHQGYTGSSNTTAGHANYGRTDAASHGLSGANTGTGVGVGGHNQESSNAGPHSSNVANKLDPRVDSDRDGRNDPTAHTGGLGQTQGYNPNSTTNAGYSATGGHGNDGHGIGNHGYATGTGTGASHGVGTTTSSHVDQPVHSSKLLNKLDPRVKDEAAANAEAARRH